VERNVLIMILDWRLKS